MKSRRTLRNIFVGAAALLLAAPLVGASSGNESVQADPLVIDIATGTVSEANGTPITTDRRSAGSDGELIETVTLSDGTTALITQHGTAARIGDRL